MVVMILYQSAVFDDIAQLIRESIRQQTGTTISIVNKPMSVSDDKTVYILLGANDLLLDNMPVNYIVWQFEQLSSRWLTDETYLKILRGAQKVLDYSQSNCKELQSKFGIKARFVPVLPMNSLDGSVSGSNNKTIDVLFCGTMNNRRRKIITDRSAYPARRNSAIMRTTPLPRQSGSREKTFFVHGNRNSEKEKH